MRFTWGTGIFLFLALFLAGAAVFIVFAARQQVNLVHKDYYEEGVDYSEQMKVDARSKSFRQSFKTRSTDKYFVVEINESLVAQMDSGILHMYRPSDYTKDLKSYFVASEDKLSNSFEFDRQKLISGRYILKVTWYADGLKYEVKRPVNVQ